MITDSAITGVMVAGRTYRSGAVAIAGGAWSSHFADQLGVPIPVVPLRGQIIHLGLPGVDTASWPLITALRRCALRPDSVSRKSAKSGLGYGPSRLPMGSPWSELYLPSETPTLRPGTAPTDCILVRIAAS